MEYDIFILRGGGQVNEDECAGLEKLLGDDVKIRKIAVTANDHVYVFYDERTELVAKETERVRYLRTIAEEMRDKKVYEKLTNAKQRNLYLCEFCHISKSDAEDVMELVKILEVEAKVMAELKEEEARHRKVMAEELTERQKAIDLERKENERKHKKEMSK